MYYLRLFHGRKSPDEKMNGWGEDGPIIGPVSLSWTYGTLKIHPPTNDDYEFLPMINDFVFYNSMYYGDIDFICGGDPLIEAYKEKVHDWETFQSNLKLK